MVFRPEDLAQRGLDVGIVTFSPPLKCQAQPGAYLPCLTSTNVVSQMPHPETGGKRDLVPKSSIHVSHIIIGKYRKLWRAKVSCFIELSRNPSRGPLMSIVSVYSRFFLHGLG